MVNVSFIIPTLNAEANLEPCLASIRAQTDQDLEILIIDGGSTDSTIEIAARYGTRVLSNPLRRAEPGKHIGIVAARGRLLAFVDADNELASPRWLESAVAALARFPKALGFESYYRQHIDDGKLNRYLTELLQISDPLAATLAPELDLIETLSSGEQLFQLPTDGRYPTGANGFVCRRSLMSALGETPFHEATFFPGLMRDGRQTLVKISDTKDPLRGAIHHHYVEGWRDLVAKRRRGVGLHLQRRSEAGPGWDASVSKTERTLAVAWHATLLGPAGYGLYRALRTRDLDWLLHPYGSLGCITGNVLGLVDALLRSVMGEPTPN